ncbi:MAG: helix-turn-helix domain-containing protein [Candidatus Avispirillum sp.]
MKNEYLKELKENCKLTTKQISGMSGIPESTISRILSGQTDNPTFDSVCAIVKAMGGSLDKLCGTQTDSVSEDLSSLHALYEKVIAEKNWYLKLLIGICCILVAVLVFILIFDIANGSVGFVRY